MTNTQKSDESHQCAGYPLFFDMHSDAVVVLDPLGAILYVNSTAEALFNRTREQLLNQRFDQLLIQELDTFRYYWQRAHHKEAHTFFLTINRAREDEALLSIKMVPNVRKGRLTCITLYITNVTGQRKEERKRQASVKDLCESAVENNLDLILLLDLDGVIVLANQAFSRFVGWRKENLEGSHVLHCPAIPAHLISQIKDYYAQVITAVKESRLGQNDKLVRTDTIRVEHEGKEHVMILSITPIYDWNGRLGHWAVHLRDVTNMKILEQKLERLAFEQAVTKDYRQMEHLNMVSQLAASISHEVRNPLTVTRGFIQLLSATNLTEDKKKHYIELSLEELDRAETIIADYLSFAKPSYDQAELLELNEEIEYTINLMNPFAMMKNTSVHLDSNVPEAHIIGESKKLHQSLLNIMKNGIEAMQEGGKLTITLRKADDQSFMLTITDTGEGMTAEQIEKLGTPYFTTKDKGTGLGTMVAFSIIRAMNGDIKVKSQKGNGTSFMISFPQYSGEPES